MKNSCVNGVLASRPFQPGDAVPATGSMCLVSGANYDMNSDQHRTYRWRKVIGYTDDLQFICLQTPGCWPTVERMANCWFADAPDKADVHGCDCECQATDEGLAANVDGCAA